MKNGSKPEHLRAILVESIKAVINGNITVQQANSISSLSAEIHKSIKMEYVGQYLAHETVKIRDGNLYIEMLED